jgi:hypothetical protein
MALYCQSLFSVTLSKTDIVSQIVAEGYTSKRYHVFEVAWNGEWSDNLDEMSRNLTIQEITESV